MSADIVERLKNLADDLDDKDIEDNGVLDEAIQYIYALRRSVAIAPLEQKG